MHDINPWYVVYLIYFTLVSKFLKGELVMQFVIQFSGDLCVHAGEAIRRLDKFKLFINDTLMNVSDTSSICEG